DSGALNGEEDLRTGVLLGDVEQVHVARFERCGAAAHHLLRGEAGRIEVGGLVRGERGPRRLVTRHVQVDLRQQPPGGRGSREALPVRGGVGGGQQARRVL